MGKNTIQKTVATTLFLYFSVILPAVALGVLNAKNTNNQISVQQVIQSQSIIFKGFLKEQYNLPTSSQITLSYVGHPVAAKTP